MFDKEDYFQISKIVLFLNDSLIFCITNIFENNRRVYIGIVLVHVRLEDRIISQK
jgi:hypothetical protein